MPDLDTSAGRAPPRSLPPADAARGRFAAFAVMLLALGGIIGFAFSQRSAPPQDKPMPTATTVPPAASAPAPPAVPATSSVVTPAVVAEPVAPANPSDIAMLPASDPATLKLQKLAAGGDLKAQYTLSLRYRDGKNVEADAAMARRLLLNAAAGGYAPAMVELAQQYESGKFEPNGIPDIHAAARWYEAAAATGSAPAALALGKIYENGLDGPPDMAMALGWYQRAAGYGSDAALGAIARLTPKSAPLKEEELRELQQALQKALGQHSQPVLLTGKLDRRTSDAIRAYQAEIGLMQDGRPSRFLLEHLRASAAATPR